MKPYKNFRDIAAADFDDDNDLAFGKTRAIIVHGSTAVVEIAVADEAGVKRVITVYKERLIELETSRIFETDNDATIITAFW